MYFSRSIFNMTQSLDPISHSTCHVQILYPTFLISLYRLPIITQHYFFPLIIGLSVWLSNCSNDLFAILCQNYHSTLESWSTLSCKMWYLQSSNHTSKLYTCWACLASKCAAIYIPYRFYKLSAQPSIHQWYALQMTYSIPSLTVPELCWVSFQTCWCYHCLYLCYLIHKIKTIRSISTTEQNWKPTKCIMKSTWMWWFCFGPRPGVVWVRCCAQIAA